MDTHKESQTPSADSNHNAKLSYKNGKNEDIINSHRKESRNLIGPKLKNQTVKLLEMTESICWGFFCLLFGSPTVNFGSSLGPLWGQPH